METSESIKKKNIYQKLVEVRKAVPFLQKDNSGYQFKYVSSSQTLGALRDAMDSQGLLLIPTVEGRNVSDHTTKRGDHNYFTQLDVCFTWINVDNPEEKVVCNWIGQGLDDGEKGVGKALTYAEKYFLLKFFNIPTDKDDPDANQKAPEPPKMPTPPKPSGPSKATPGQMKAISDKYKGNTPDAIMAACIKIIGRDVKSASDLTFQEAELIITGK